MKSDLKSGMKQAAAFSDKVLSTEAVELRGELQQAIGMHKGGTG